MLGDGAREDDFLEVFAFEGEALGGVLMADARYILVDDGTGIKLGRDIVAGGTDNLHAALPGLVVGFGAHEGGQEGVVDVDDVVGVGGNHLIADNLHIACQHDERDAVLAQQLHLGGLHLGFVGVVLVDAPHVVGDIELLGDVAQVLMVADDAGDIDSPLAGFVARQQVVEAVAHAADEDGHARALVGEVEVECHLVALRVECGKILLDLVLGDEEALQLPFNAHEEHAVLTIDILVEIDDVTFVVGDELGDLGDDARLVGAVKE